MRDTDFFIVNFDRWERELKQVYVDHFDPKCLVQFALLLPFRLPVDGACFTIFPEEGIAHTFVLAQFAVFEEVPAGVLSSELLRIPRSRTRAELVLVASRELIANNVEEEQLVGFMENTFRSLLLNLNLLLTAYLVATADMHVHRVTQEMIGPIYYGRYVHLDNWPDAKLGVYVVPPEPLIGRPDTLSQGALTSWRAYFNRMSNDPFLVSKEIGLIALRHLNHGLYSEAVIFAQARLEVFLDTIYANLCQSEGTEVREIAFMAMVKKELPHRLGGNWNVDNETIPAGKWYRHVYQLRNKLVHAGYHCTKKEAERALVAADRFHDWLVSRIVARKVKYPLLFSYFQEEAS